ncbi:MAG: UDP-N-acetylmuramate dehydrogenase, partial [Magnetococcus sp. WYHC-3]
VAGNARRVVIGGGSNLLADDRGFDGVVMDLTAACGELTPHAQDPQRLWIGAGVDTRAASHGARHRGLAGLEFLAGIPGTVGGAIRMNAGAYGSDIRAVLETVTLLDPAGGSHTWPAERLELTYRHARLEADWLILGGEFRLHRDDPEAIRQRIREMHGKRRSTQPLGWPSAGSVFKNPPGAAKAWELIDRAGLRGAREGDAEISPLHSNFFVNRGQASAAQMRALVQRTREAVVRHSGVTLELEVRLLEPTGWRPSDAG